MRKYTVRDIVEAGEREEREGERDKYFVIAGVGLPQRRILLFCPDAEYYEQIKMVYCDILRNENETTTGTRINLLVVRGGTRSLKGIYVRNLCDSIFS